VISSFGPFKYQILTLIFKNCTSVPPAVSQIPVCLFSPISSPRFESQFSYFKFLRFPPNPTRIAEPRLQQQRNNFRFHSVPSHQPSLPQLGIQSYYFRFVCFITFQPHETPRWGDTESGFRSLRFYSYESPNSSRYKQQENNILLCSPKSCEIGLID